jgi:hypothetical protein
MARCSTARPWNAFEGITPVTMTPVCAAGFSTAERQVRLMTRRGMCQATVPRACERAVDQEPESR